MKNVKRTLVIVLTLAIAFSMVACGGNSEGEATVAPVVSDVTPVPDYSTLAGLSDEQLANYIVKYSVTTIQYVTDENGENVQDEFGVYKTEQQTKDYIEVGFTGYIIKSSDGGASFALDASQTSCFTIESQNDPRGLFSANAKFENYDELTKGATGTVAGLPTTTYTYKSGMFFNYDMYINEDYKITLKYVNNLDPASISVGGFVSMEVTELTFGTVTNELFQEYFAKQATPAPAPEAPAAE